MEDIERIVDVAKLPRRQADSHKGDFGRVLVVGGSRGMIGAVALAANAAFRGGAGLVTFAASQDIQPFVATLCPCATSIPLGDDAVRQIVRASADADVLAVGPGMGTGLRQREIVRASLEQEKPLVLDADGLNNLCAIDDWPTIRRCPLVLTPHPGEFAKLTGQKVDDVQADRENAAISAVKNWMNENLPLICVLKGAGTVVTDGRKIYVNKTGNPGLATGGSGDVLTGLTTAIIGQGLSLFDAACLAVHSHGQAGDLAAKKLGEVSMMAADLLDFLPEVMKNI